MKTQDTVWQSLDGRTSIVRVAPDIYALIRDGRQVMPETGWGAVADYYWAEFNL